MPGVDAFEVAGLDIRFFSNDHMPPHLQVTRTGEWQIRVFLLETTSLELAYDVVYARRPVRRGLQRELAGLVVRHRRELLAEWEAKVLGS